MADVDERAVILAYHEATKHSPASVRARAHYLDWDNRPFPFKVYTDLERMSLPEDIPSLDVPALEAIGVTSVLDPAPGPDLAALARLLVLGAGVHHTKTFREGEVPYFRNYASAGALYPVEVYVGCADLPGLPAGVYHFDPQGPTLTLLREGDHLGHLVRAAAGEPAVARAPVVLALTGIPWRTAWKYTERGYRHLFWDAGMILANVLALAASVRLQVRVVLGFADAEVSALLGLEEQREFPLCLVPIGASDSEIPPAAESPEEVSFRVLPFSQTEHVYQGILRANDAGRLDAPKDARTWRHTVFAREQATHVDTVNPGSRAAAGRYPADRPEIAAGRAELGDQLDRLDQATTAHRMALSQLRAECVRVKEALSRHPEATHALDRMPEVEKTSIFGTAVHAVLRSAGSCRSC
jgi:SagB-type dehydrogenase family enzyme